MDINAKKYGVTKLILNLRRNFELELAALEDKYTALLADFCNKQGEGFSELLDVLCLDPSDRYRNEASNAFKKLHEHQLLVCEIEEHVKASSRVQYIQLFEASLKRALEQIDHYQNELMKAAFDRFARENPT